jgi:hypothetical protein
VQKWLLLFVQDEEQIKAARKARKRRKRMRKEFGRARKEHPIINEVFLARRDAGRLASRDANGVKS